MSGKESTFINDIANSKLLLYSADFTESSYDYIPSAQRCPAEREECQCQVVVGKRISSQNGLSALNSGVILLERAGKVTAWSGSASPAVLGRKRLVVVLRKTDAEG